MYVVNGHLPIERAINIDIKGLCTWGNKAD